MIIRESLTYIFKNLIKIIFSVNLVQYMELGQGVWFEVFKQEISKTVFVKFPIFRGTP